MTNLGGIGHFSYVDERSGQICLCHFIHSKPPEPVQGEGQGSHLFKQIYCFLNCKWKLKRKEKKENQAGSESHSPH